MITKSIAFLLHTHERPVYYWLIGATLIWAVLPIGLADSLLAPYWHAPHWQCDTMAIPVMQALMVAFPWAIFAALVSALLAFFAARARVAGINILNFRSERKVANWIVTLPLALLSALVLYGIFKHFWEVFVPQTITSDCNGSAEPITKTMRGPLLQLLPFHYCLLIWWLLHLRAFFLSPRKPVDRGEIDGSGI